MTKEKKMVFLSFPPNIGTMSRADVEEWVSEVIPDLQNQVFGDDDKPVAGGQGLEP